MSFSWCVVLALVTCEAATIVRIVPWVDQPLERILRNFQLQLTGSQQRRSDRYKQPARKRYDILIAAIAHELDGLNLDLGSARPSPPKDKHGKISGSILANPEQTNDGTDCRRPS